MKNRGKLYRKKSGTNQKNPIRYYNILFKIVFNSIFNEQGVKQISFSIVRKSPPQKNKLVEACRMGFNVVVAAVVVRLRRFGRGNTCLHFPNTFVRNFIQDDGVAPNRVGIAKIFVEMNARRILQSRQSSRTLYHQFKPIKISPTQFSLKNQTRVGLY